MRYAVRRLMKSPGFSLVSVVLMALGIGATTSLFGLTYSVLLKPLPWPEPDQLVRLQETRGGRTGRVPWTISNTTFHAWHDHHDTIEDVGGWMRGQMMTLGGPGVDGRRVVVGRMTPGLLGVLRTSPRVGRPFSEDDATTRGGPTVVLLGYALWQDVFAGDPAIVGRGLRLDDRLATIVGVMPEGFSFPDRTTQAWLPLGVARVAAGADVISGQILNAIARLRPGAAVEQATAEASARGRGAPSLGRAGLGLFGSNGQIAVTAVPARDALTADVRPALIVLLAAVALIFVTAIVSVLMLQTSRAARRRRETAIRVALGARRSDLLGPWLAEAVCLGAVGGTAGTLLAAALRRALPAILPPDFPRVNEFRLDATVMSCAIGLTLIVAVACALLPAVFSRERLLQDALSSDGSASGPPAAARATGLRIAMMSAQVAVACVLLVGTGLLARSFAVLLEADRGYDPHDLLTAHLFVQPSAIAAQPDAPERVRQRLAGLPGVVAAGFGNALPFVTSGGFVGLTLPAPHDASVQMQVQGATRIVSPEYFQAMRLRVLAGRGLLSTDSPTSRPVLVVNKTFAERYLGNDPIGTMLPAALGAHRNWEVVGVIDDVRQGGFSGASPQPLGGLNEPPLPEIYLPWQQAGASGAEIVYLVRGANAAALAPALRDILRDELPRAVPDSVMTMEDRVAESVARPRVYAALLGGFALFALAIATAGLFGVTSYMTAQRTREIGIRSALGARPADIIGLVSREASLVFAIGLSAGLTAATLLARSLTPLLYKVPVHDAASFVGAPVVLLLTVALACAIPARRATQLDPQQALRHQ